MGGEEEEELVRKENPETIERVDITVHGQDGEDVFFRVHKNAHLKKLMNKYCERQHLEQNTIAFLFDGHLINGDQTPRQLGIEDGDEIDAMKHHIGGSNPWFP